MPEWTKQAWAWLRRRTLYRTRWYRSSRYAAVAMDRIQARDDDEGMDGEQSHNYVTSPVTFQIRDAIMLRLGTPQDTPANRLAARREGLAYLEGQRSEEGRWHGMRDKHAVSHLMHAVNLVFVPDHEEAVAWRMRNSKYARSRRARYRSANPTF